MPPYNTLPDSDKQLAVLVGKLTGFRIQIESIDVPETLARELAFPVTVNWKNVGVAPIYETWDIMFQFRDSNGNVIYQVTTKSTTSHMLQSKSMFNLKTLLPSTDVTSATDMITIPSSVVPGNYKVYLKIVDPKEFR